MRFVSTRGGAPAIGLGAAIAQGLAPDGGLYMPERWPEIDMADVSPSATLAQVAAAALAPFAQGDPLAADVAAIAEAAFDFPAPLNALDEHTGVLELFHGPTAAFKDFGARFLAGALSHLRSDAERPLLVLVATSGDTGAAVASAFHAKPGIEVVVLFPKGLVSPAQQHQLTCWDGNVRSYAVCGTFDNCQRMVKQAFSSAELAARYDLTSANSINLGRLLPQMSYFGHASLHEWREYGEELSFVVPSGNLGHATACVWARRIGFPIGAIVLAHNANRALPNYIESGRWSPRPSIATLASAMDVGDPSNAERLFHLFPDVASLRAALSADSVDDEAIRARIRDDFVRYGKASCPHTAVAAEALHRHRARGVAGRWAIVATAHPAKFRGVVEPLISAAIAEPPALAALSARPSHFEEIEPSLEALIDQLI